MEPSLRRYISFLPDIYFQTNVLSALKDLECYLQAFLHILAHPIQPDANKTSIIDNNNNNNSNSNNNKGVELFVGDDLPSWVSVLKRRLNE